MIRSMGDLAKAIFNNHVDNGGMAVARFTGFDTKQIDALPEYLRKKLLSPHKEEFTSALREIGEIERVKNKELLGPAAMDYLEELHASLNGYKKEY